jgi:mRNA interferase MazF
MPGAEPPPIGASGSEAVHQLARGDIVIVADRRTQLGSKPRPAIIFQNPQFSGTATVMVCPITSVTTEASYLRIALPVDPVTGLEQPSWAAIELLGPIRRSNVGQRIGRLDDASLLAIDRALVVFLGIAT